MIPTTGILSLPSESFTQSAVGALTRTEGQECIEFAVDCVTVFVHAWLKMCLYFCLSVSL